MMAVAVNWLRVLFFVVVVPGPPSRVIRESYAGPGASKMSPQHLFLLVEENRRAITGIICARYFSNAVGYSEPSLHLPRCVRKPPHRRNDWFEGD